MEVSEPSDAMLSVDVKETLFLTESEKRTQVARSRWRHLHLYFSADVFLVAREASKQRLQQRLSRGKFFSSSQNGEDSHHYNKNRRRGMLKS